MTTSEQRWLEELLPAVYRVRDEQTGGPLRALLAVIQEQADALRQDLDDLYADWFIETCRDWVVPYVGELIGYRSATGTTAAGVAGTADWQLRARYLTPRRDVANSLVHRRRKGTLALLEQLAADVAGWPARAVEHHPLLVVTQHPNHLRLERGRTVDLRDRDALDRIGGAFDDVAHVVAAGRIDSRRTRRRHNIPNVGLFVWRLLPLPVTHAPARNIDRARNQFTFDVLGVNQPLVTKPVAEPDPNHVADELNVPAFIRRIAFELDTNDYYGDGRSLCVYRPAPGARGNQPALEPYPRSDVIAADLSHWQYRPQPGQVAIDPVLGRIAFHPRTPVGHGIWVSYQRGTPAEMGGGAYPRPVRAIGTRQRYTVGRGGAFATITRAYEQWQLDRADTTRQDAVIEILDNEEYVEAVPIVLRRGDRLEIRAAQGRIPLIRLVDLHANRPDSWEIEAEASEPRARKAAPSDCGEPEVPGGTPPSEAEAAKRSQASSSARPDQPEASTGTSDGPASTGGGTGDGAPTPTPVSGARPAEPCGPPTAPCGDCGPTEPPEAPDSPPRLVLDGLVIAGRSVRIRGAMGMVVIRHSTLVPGWWLEDDCEPVDAEEPSLELEDVCGGLVVERSIVGTIVVSRDEVQTEPMPIAITDSIIDATRPELFAISGPGGRRAHVALTIRQSTVFGRAALHRLELGEDSIFVNHLSVTRRQVGCLRFSYVPPESRTPRRYECQPDAAKSRVREAFGRGELSGAERDEQLLLADLRVRPRFDSVRYRTPAYARLSEHCPVEIAAGASDGSEMGAYHDLFQPIREANLQARLDEYVPAGTNAGIVYVT